MIKNTTPNYPYLAGYLESSLKSLISSNTPGIKVTNYRTFEKHIMKLIEEANQSATTYESGINNDKR